MPWNPEKYNQFKSIRNQPFFDLMELISNDGLQNGLDIGCGTGEQTKILSEKFDTAIFLGIDPSPEMLAQSRNFESERLSFRSTTVEAFLTSDAGVKRDLIFSNAALQWSDHHEELFPRLISLLNNDGGQLAVQVPVQKENLLNKILADLVQEKPFVNFLSGWKRLSPVLSIDEYAQIMFENGLSDIRIMQKVYPIIADSPETLLDFISGSSLVPYMEKMSEKEQQIFIPEYRSRVQKAFKRFPAIYAFKRLLLYGRRN